MGDPCSVVPLQNCREFPCSHTFSLFVPLVMNLLTMFRPLICKVLFPCSLKIASCSLVPLDILPMFPCSPKPLGDPQYVHQCYVVNNLIESLKSSYYTDIINEHSSDQKILFKTVGKLLQKSTNKRYPPSSDDTALANSFADFLTSKIDKIHHGLVERKIRVGSSPPDVTVCGAEFCNLAEVTQEEIKKFSRKLLSKSCELDPLPAVVLKGCLTALLPTHDYEDRQCVLIDRCYA